MINARQGDIQGVAEEIAREVNIDGGDRCLVCLFADGSFKKALEKNQVSVRILSKQSLQIYQDNLRKSLWLGKDKQIIVFDK